MSKKMIRGLGLTVTELMLARTTAIRYAGKRDKPARLVEMMVRFGVDFLTMMPLEAEQTKVLRLASSSYWDLMIASAPDDGEDSSSDESELSVGWDAGDQTDPLPTQGTPEYTETVTRHRKSAAVLRVCAENNSGRVSPVIKSESVSQSVSQYISLEPIIPNNHNTRI